MRFFIAIEIPKESRVELEAVQQQLKKLIPQARLTDSDKLHLTIAFVGEQPEQLIEKLIDILKKAVEGIPKFEVTPAYIDGFPKLHYAHTLWAGVKGDIDKLLLVRERVKDGLTSLHLEVDERRYTPHIALAKLTNFHLTASQEIALEQIMAVNFSPIQVNSIKLFQSIPDEGFHTHNTLAEVSLA